MGESWYKEECPECESINWFNNGDESDLTAMDIESVKCRSCGYIWSVDEMVGEEDLTPQAVREEDWDCELGLEHPR